MNLSRCLGGVALAAVLFISCSGSEGGSGSTGSHGTGGTGTGSGGAAPSGGGGNGETGGAEPTGGGAPGGSNAGGTGGAVGLEAGVGGAAEGGGIGGGTQVIVNAGAFDRSSTIVSFSLPGGAGKSFVLRDDQGGQIPVQVDDNGIASFVLPSLKAGAEATFTLQENEKPAPGVTAVQETDGVKLMIGALTVFRYQMQGKLPAGIDKKYLRGGYIHPLYTPGGVLVTDDYPPDHRHHHGIWSAWVESSFQGRMMDFWNMGQGTAKVDFDSLGGTWDGAVHAGLRAKHVFVDLTAPQPTTVLHEQWVVRLYKTHDTAPPYFVFDLDSTQDAATTSPLMLLEYRYGGFGIRGHRQWFPATFLTSEGKDRLAGDATTGRWCHIGGMVDGKPAGYAILGHPTNFRAPQPMRLNPDDPFMSYAPVKAGPFSIDPGKSYVSRFRFVVTDGAADKVLLDRVWNDYATPPTVTVR
jgi:hypothetical protein